MAAIGIDLGTTNSLIAQFHHNRPEIIANEEGDRKTNSIVYYENNGEVIVGKHALKNKNPENIIYDSKRILGQPFDNLKGLEHYPFKVINDNNKPKFEVRINNEVTHKTPEEVSGEILKTLAKAATIRTEAKWKNKAVITVPAYFNHSQREGTITAAKLAGIEVIRLINEPTAAALYYAHQFKDLNQTPKKILIYDFGGGTFDVSIIQLDGQTVTVKGISGDTNIGGKDIDQRLVDKVIKYIKDKYGQDITSAKHLKTIREKCVAAKEALFTNKKHEIHFEHNLLKGIKEIISLELTQETLFQDNLDIFNQTIKIVKNCLKTNKLKPTQIDEVILVGGSSRIPKVEQLLKELFGEQKVLKVIGPDECVALGAAICAAMVQKNPNNIIEIIELIDILPFSLGTSVENQKTSFLLKKNTPLPAQSSKVYKTIFDQQDTMLVDVFEGENEYVNDNVLLKALHIHLRNKSAAGQAAVHISFRVDVNGILHVSAYEDGEEDMKNELEISLKSRWTN